MYILKVVKEIRSLYVGMQTVSDVTSLTAGVSISYLLCSVAALFDSYILVELSLCSNCALPVLIGLFLL